jgi:16S rRNA (adenine1518-N6/adenine1519-N6)-dimethyltransferase
MLTKLKDKIISKDFLRYDINEVFQGAALLEISYNISTQIVLKRWNQTSILSLQGCFKKKLLSEFCEKKKE